MKEVIFSVIVIASVLTFLGYRDTSNAKTISNSSQPIILELFTSQSCSSCPAADKVLSELAIQNENIIALSCHVTYWNHLHWKDTLSTPLCTDRQRQYVQTLQSRGPYTPQIIINGRHETVGSRKADILRHTSHDLKNNPVKPIDLSLTNSELQISLPAIEKGGYQLTLISYGDNHTEEILRGENRGRTISYIHPVQDIINLGHWDGTALPMMYDLSILDKAVGYTIIAQKNSTTGPIVAAAQIKY